MKSQALHHGVCWEYKRQWVEGEKGEFHFRHTENFFSISSGKHWYRSSREAVQSLSLEVFKIQLGQFLNNLAWPCSWQVGLQTCQGPFQPERFYDPQSLFLMGTEQVFMRHESSYAVCDHLKQHLNQWRGVNISVLLALCKAWGVSWSVLGRDCFGGMGLCVTQNIFFLMLLAWHILISVNKNETKENWRLGSKSKLLKLFLVLFSLVLIYWSLWGLCVLFLSWE